MGRCSHFLVHKIVVQKVLNTDRCILISIKINVQVEATISRKEINIGKDVDQLLCYDILSIVRVHLLKSKRSRISQHFFIINSHNVSLEIIYFVNVTGEVTMENSMVVLQKIINGTTISDPAILHPGVYHRVK